MLARPWLALAFAVSVGSCAPQRGTIGAMLVQSSSGVLTIRDVPEGLGAHEAGLQPGDRILLIDGRDVRVMDARAVHQHLGGAVGEEVRLTVLRGDQVIRVTLRRTPAQKYQGG